MSMLVSALLIIGGFFCFVAALGIWRFQDFYARVHAATKASTFGFGFTVLAAAAHLGTVSAWFKALLALFFLFITSGFMHLEETIGRFYTLDFFVF